MSRKNHPVHARANPHNSFRLDYTNLPEYPEYGRIIAVPLRTAYVNLSARFDGTQDYIAKDRHDPMLKRMGVC